MEENTSALAVNITQFIMTAPPTPPFRARLMPSSRTATAKEHKSAAIARASRFFLAIRTPVISPDKNSESIEKTPRYPPGDGSIYANGEKNSAHAAYVITA